MMNDKTGILLQCVRVEIVGKELSDFGFCVFDNGSERTFVKKSVSKKLGLKVVGSEKLNIYSFGAKTPRLQVCRRVELKLRNVLNGYEVVMEALEIEEISKAAINFPDRGAHAEMAARGYHLTFDIRELSSNCQISVLLGSDYYWDLIKGFERLNSSLVAVNTELGWSLQGKCSKGSKSTSVNLVQSDLNFISAELRRFWELESLGIEKTETDCLSVKEQEIVQEFNDTTRFVDGRYCVKLPWKAGMKEKLANNREGARKRFGSLVKRFRRNLSFFEDYKKVIDGYLEEGVVEKSSCDTELSRQEPSFYLPHHAVIREDKSTTRLRIVFDGSSHEDNELSITQRLLVQRIEFISKFVSSSNFERIL